ncbi:MAG: NAD(P)/FAD-dependent oxidoreductase [Candidatus Omnitrophica bacterium]|nr:NAD(P)/FAD-dependent oxidoreductase [Candidatus Omnitrophota bacterium]MBU4487916.1 NAD(P)/FAD-dependent oxidoreductase [Candidatus Omnitrophota bacterium]MCG2705623.1 NAD(P)/FAD-dependent oxidoreductase [Candidatus Omnitrophota bacterium]
MRDYDVAIIGGGVTGSAIARELARFRLKIILFEKEEELTFGVSKSNSGIIHPGTQNPANSLKGRLCVRGNTLIRQTARELGVDFKEVGELIVAFNESDTPKLLSIKKEAETLGVRGLAVVDKKWLREKEPNLSEDAVAALYAPTAGIISPYRLVYDLSENAAKNGVEIHTKTKVVNIVESGGSFEIDSTGGRFRSRFVINAAGLFADDISKMVGVDYFKITPRKGEEFLLDKKREHIVNHLLFPLPSKNTKGILIIKTADGNPMIGPSAEDVDEKEDLSTSDTGLKKVLESAKRMMPSISEDDIIAYFAGLRPVASAGGLGTPSLRDFLRSSLRDSLWSSDILSSVAGEDFIVRHEKSVPGFVNVAGIQSPGLTSAPAIALMVCGILKDAGLPMRRKLFFHGHRQKTIHLFAIPFSKTQKLIEKDAAYGDIVCRCEMVSAKEVRDAIKRGAGTFDGIKFRTRAQAGRCHGSFCTTRLMKILAEELKEPVTSVTKRGKGSEIVKGDRKNG